MSFMQSNYLSNVTPDKNRLKHHLIPLILREVLLREGIVKCQSGKNRHDIGSRSFRRDIKKTLR